MPRAAGAALLVTLQAGRSAKRERLVQGEGVRWRGGLTTPSVVRAFQHVCPARLQVTSHSGDDLDAKIHLIEQKLLAGAGVHGQEVRVQLLRTGRGYVCGCLLACCIISG